MNLILLSVAPLLGYSLIFWTSLSLNLTFYLLKLKKIHPIFIVSLACVFQDPLFSLYGFPIWFFVLIVYTISSLWRNYTYFCKNLNTQIALFTLLFTVSHAALAASSFNAIEFALRVAIMIFLVPNLIWHDISSMTNAEKKTTRKYINFLLLGCCICGFLQLSSNFTGVGEPLIGYAFRPTAFASESTWFGLIGLIGLINSGGEKSYFWKASMVIFLVAIMISESRNAYIGLILYALLFNRVLLIYLVVVAFLMSLYLFDVLNMSTAFERFRLNDLSSAGRFVAYSDSLNLIKSNFFGTGWEYFYSKGAQPTVGSKSFNLVFHFFHVYGWFGVIPILSLLHIYFLNSYFKLSLVKLKSLTILFALCMFAPVHFSPFYVIILISIGLNLMLNDRDRKNYTPNK